MTLVFYEDRYIRPLASMLDKFFKEVFKHEYTGDLDKAEQMCIRLVYEGRTTYLLLNDYNEPIGFIIGHLTDQFGMTESKLVVEYTYLEPEYRSGLAVAYIAYMLALICKDCNCGAYMNTHDESSSGHSVALSGAKQIATTYSMTNEEAIKIYNKYKRRIEK